MRRAALACCVVIACNSGDKPAERAPREMPIALRDAEAAPADATNVTAPASPCFALPFDATAEHAGIRRLAHRASHVETDVLLAVPKGVTRLDPGQRTRVTGVHPPLIVPPIGADALVAMAQPKGKDLELTAPAHLEGAVVELQGGDGAATLAIGNTGLLALLRYRDKLVAARVAKQPTNGYDITGEKPIWVIADDIDGDGTVELIALSSVEWRLPEGGHQKKPDLHRFELGVIWQSGEVAFAPLTEPSAIYLVQPLLSGGKPLLMALDGARIVVEQHTLTALPDELSLRGGATMCLQTSATEPARLVAKP